jgi:hypothetical protein
MLPLPGSEVQLTERINSALNPKKTQICTIDRLTLAVNGVSLFFGI